MVEEQNEPDIDAFFDQNQFNDILLWASNNGYSDVIITSDQHIYYRRNRLTFRSRQNPLSENNVADTARWIASDGATVKALTGDFYDTSYTTPKALHSGNASRFRANITRIHSSHCENALAIVLRIVAGEPWDLSRHQLTHHFQKHCFSETGLNLVVGPMGSGKTTLVASMIKHINISTNKYIVSFEDPIEFDFGLVQAAVVPVAQTEVGAGIKSFKDALANVTRRSADVIFWGESRDPYSIISLTVACNLGASVYTTAHANSVASAVPRLIRMFNAAQRDGMQAALISSLQTICFQRLLPSLTGGVVALREYLILNDEVKRALIDLNITSLSIAIRDIQQSQGGGLAAALDQLFDKQLISSHVYQGEVQKHIKASNYCETTSRLRYD